jgi:hypothetical protein
MAKISVERKSINTFEIIFKLCRRLGHFSERKNNLQQTLRQFKNPDFYKLVRAENFPPVNDK